MHADAGYAHALHAAASGAMHTDDARAFRKGVLTKKRGPSTLKVLKVEDTMGPKKPRKQHVCVACALPLAGHPKRCRTHCYRCKQRLEECECE